MIQSQYEALLDIATERASAAWRQGSETWGVAYVDALTELGLAIVSSEDPRFDAKPFYTNPQIGRFDEPKLWGLLDRIVEQEE